MDTFFNSIRLLLPTLFLMTWVSGCDEKSAFVERRVNEKDPSDQDQVNDDIQKEDNYEQQKELCKQQGISEADCLDKYALMVQESEQAGPGNLDVLWIIDNSGSMTEEQTYLGNNFGNFIAELVKAETDFQVALATTNACQNPIPTDLTQVRCPGLANTNGPREGSFIGEAGKKVLSAQTSDLSTRFVNYANVGINGAGFEHGLTSAKLAIEKVLSGENEPLLRDGSFLSVIVVSDEEDDGIGLSQTDGSSQANYWTTNQTRYKFTDDDLISYLTGVKGSKFSVSAIVPTYDSATGKPCTSAHSKPTEVGKQYIAAAEKTGGIVQSICLPDWSKSLANMGQHLNAQMSQIKFSKKPVEGSIQVFINDKPSSHWQYDAPSRTLKFDPEHIPAAGAKIRVEYLTKA